MSVFTGLSSAYYFDVDRRIWIPQSRASEFGYNDGDTAEEYVQLVISEAQDLRTGSDDLRAAIKDWPSLCHLSPSRANLLRPLADLLTGDILEVGSGCGALTRFLAETASHVTAVEGSFRRASITAARCRPLKNVDVICDRFSALEMSRKFDCVLLIGVLEYCQLFETQAKPPIALLRRCASLLKRGGRLIVAIENRYGLKYFAGAPEDHLNTPYSGIEGHYNRHSPITWSRSELLNLLRESGLPYVQELYPFPDYKFPRLVLTKASLEYGGEIGQLLSSTGQTRHSAVSYVPSFSESAAWGGLFRAGLVPELTNSFLFIASDRAQEPIEGAYLYSTHWRRVFQHEAVFRRGEAGVNIERSRLFPDRAVGSALNWRSHDSRFYAGTPYSAECDAVLKIQDWTLEQLCSWFSPFQRFLASRVLPAESRQGEALLAGTDIECTPYNTAFGSESGFQCFDQKFEWNEPVSLNYVLFRGLYGTLLRIGSAAPTRNVEELRIAGLVRLVLNRNGVPVTEAETGDYLRRESAFLEEATGQRPSEQSLAEAELKLRLNSVTEEHRTQCFRSQLLDANAEREKWRSECVSLQLQMAALAQQVQTVSAAYAAAEANRALAEAACSRERELRVALEGSNSWKITAPLRHCAEWVRGKRKE